MSVTEIGAPPEPAGQSGTAPKARRYQLSGAEGAMLHTLWLALDHDDGGPYAVAQDTVLSQGGTLIRFSGDTLALPPARLSRWIAELTAIHRTSHGQDARIVMSASGLQALVAVELLLAMPGAVDSLLLHMPVTDLLRYHRLGDGVRWLEKLGDPELARNTAALRARSPLTRLARLANWPATLIETDTRGRPGHPAHGRKLAAMLAEQGRSVLYAERPGNGLAEQWDGAAMSARARLQLAFIRARNINRSWPAATPVPPTRPALVPGNDAGNEPQPADRARAARKPVRTPI